MQQQRRGGFPRPHPLPGRLGGENPPLRCCCIIYSKTISRAHIGIEWPGNVRQLISEQKSVIAPGNAECFTRLREGETLMGYICRGALAVYAMERAHLGSHSAAAHRLGMHCKLMCATPDLLSSKPALSHPNVGDSLHHLSHNTQVDNINIISLGDVS